MELLRMLIQLTVLAAMAAPASAQAKPGCQDSCGNVSIPYPFGTNPDCYYDETFLISCNTVFDPPKPFLADSNIEIENITLDGQIRILQYIARNCYNPSGYQTKSNVPHIGLSKFRISRTKNKFTAIGCDTRASIVGKKDNMTFLSGCMTKCLSLDYVTNGSCSGIGCCQTSIPEGVKNYTVQLASYNKSISVWNFSPCSYAFVVEEDKFNFSSNFLTVLDRVDRLPVVLDWAIGTETSCEVANKSSNYACKGHSTCYGVDFGPEYRCNCSEGYYGNPYLPDGCKDIDECSDENQCESTCKNIAGSYECFCPKGYHGDGKKNGSGCTADVLMVIKIVLGAGLGLLALILVCSSLYWVIRKKRMSQRKKKFFAQNGGLILRKRLKEDTSDKAVKQFTIEELKMATNDFDENRIVNKRGGFGTVYEGRLPEHERVAIKKCLEVDQSQLLQFINELIVLSKIDHRNVVKLLGCCLEAESPIMVYEFIGNESLSRHIHEVKNEENVFSWENRLRVATETAQALSNLHTKDVIHRNVKSSNILLDDEFTAKVSDFGVSRKVPIGNPQVKTIVQGTVGYLDPEYFYTSHLSEKSDVYSFGVVLAELITGRSAVSLGKSEKETLLTTFFISSMNDKLLLSIIDARIVNEVKHEQVREVAELAQRCLSLEGDKRPTMSQVRVELEEIMGKPEEVDELLGEPVGNESMKGQATVPSEGYTGR